VKASAGLEIVKIWKSKKHALPFPCKIYSVQENCNTLPKNGSCSESRNGL